MRCKICAISLLLCFGCSDLRFRQAAAPRDAEQDRSEAPPAIDRDSLTRDNSAKVRINHQGRQSIEEIAYGYELGYRTAFDVGYKDGLSAGEVHRLFASVPRRGDKLARLAALEAGVDGIPAIPLSAEEYAESSPRFRSLPEHEKGELIRGYKSGWSQGAATE